MVVDTSAVTMVAQLMELAARTSPKVKGVDTILIRILTGKEIQALADHLADTGEKCRIIFFIRDAKNIAACAMPVSLWGDRPVHGMLSDNPFLTCVLWLRDPFYLMILSDRTSGALS